MKNISLLIALFLFSVISCKSVNSTTYSADATLEGTWQLNYITGPRIAFDGLYPRKKPSINFDLVQNKVSGNNSCNQFFGALKTEGNKIDFKDTKMGMTMMACPGNGDAVFMKTLEKIDSYSISADGKTLAFKAGNFEMMRFERVEKNLHNAQNSLSWAGTYKGITPCADCQGMETTIVLNQDLTYSFQTKYIGKGDGKVMEEKGTFSWDKTGNRVLLPLNSKIVSKYSVQENKLVQLDRNGKIITGALADKYILTKE